LDENNKSAAESGDPIVDTAPPPARAQFLNVIESIFSGMARAIIQNSDYRSVDEAKGAIDRDFDARNRHLREHRGAQAKESVVGSSAVGVRGGELRKDPGFR
jgi:hypothetical protein